MILSGPFLVFAHLIAPATAAPPEPPTKRPSRRVMSRVIEKHSLSSTRTMSSRILRFIVVGKKSSPMPSTLYEKGLVMRPVFTKS